MRARRLRIVSTLSGLSHGFADVKIAAQLSGVHPGMIIELVRAELVVPARQDREGNPYFDETGIHRLRQIQGLRQEEGTNMRTIRLIMTLLDRIDTTEREVARLRERLRLHS